MEYETMNYESDGSVCWITLNRPEKRNAINLQFTIDLRNTLLQAQRDEKVKVVVITGKGSIFCAGADLSFDTKIVEKNIPLSQLFLETNLHFHSAISIIANMKKPVIAAVQGGAAGAGMSLALACDIIFVSDKTKFNWAYTQRGLVPDGASSQNLPRRIGIHRTLEIAFTGKVLSAQEAKEWGIVNEIYPDDKFMDEVKKIANKIASGPIWAYGITKHLIRQSYSNSLETQLELENQAIAEASTKEDFVEGVMAFLQKREPKFKGK